MTTATPTKTPTRCNGVDVQGVLETIEAIENDPSLADFEFRARNRWIDGPHNRSTIQGFYGAGREDDSRAEPYVFDNGEPPVLGGANEGANPVEFLLHGIAGCITTTFIYYAALEGIEIKGLETSFEGDIDVQGLLGLSEDVRPGYQEIRVQMKVDSDAPESKIQELVALAQSRSPVTQSVMSATPVVVTPVKA